MADPPLIAGLVLAGGRSRRFGSEKAVALHRGRPLLDWSLEALSPHCALVAVNAPGGSAAAALARQHGLPVLSDAPGDPDGPLAGVRAGLAWASGQKATWLATVPCDTPDLPADLVPRLGAAASAAGAYAASPDGRQPLCALWSVSLLDPLGRTLAEGHHPPVWKWQDQYAMRPAHFEGATAFTNLNRADRLRSDPDGWSA